MDLPQLHTSTKTFLGRYWREFNCLARWMPGRPGLAILSFGCSTGEELATIRLVYPRARLVGCDIDPAMRQAAAALLGPGIPIVPPAHRQLSALGPFDIVLCNSVLMRPTAGGHGGRRGLDAAVWLDTVACLGDLIAPGGILQIVNSNIPFRYHPLALDYEPLCSPEILGPNFVDMFDPDGRHLCSGIPGAGWSALLHRHFGEAGWRELQPRDFHDIHFRKPGGGALPAPAPPKPDKRSAAPWAAGKTFYGVAPVADARPSTHVEVDCAWTAHGVDRVEIEREARRVWFDGGVAWRLESSEALEGPAASAFIESVRGEPARRLSIERLLAEAPAPGVRSPSF